jgi:hypothetical protein
MVVTVLSFFTMSSLLSWEGWAMHFPFSCVKFILSLSFYSLRSWYTISSIPGNSSSKKDLLAGEQQALAHGNIVSIWTYVHNWGWWDFRFVVTTSWETYNMIWSSISFLWEHRSISYFSWKARFPIFSLSTWSLSKVSLVTNCAIHDKELSCSIEMISYPWTKSTWEHFSSSCSLVDSSELWIFVMRTSYRLWRASLCSLALFRSLSMTALSSRLRWA